MVTIAFFVKGINGVGSRIKRYETAIAAATGPPDAQMLAGVDLAVSRIQTKNFDFLRNAGAWPPINFLTLLLSRNNAARIRGQVGSFSEGNALAARNSLAKPLHDRGRLRRSLQRGGEEHYAKIVGNTIRIGTSVPYAKKHLRGGSATFEDGKIKFVREPHTYRNKKTGKTWQGTKLVPKGNADARIRAMVAPPTAQNNFFANRLRFYLSKNPARTRVVPRRSWIRKFSSEDRRFIVDAVAAAIGRRLTFFEKSLRLEKFMARIEARALIQSITGLLPGNE